MFGGAIMSDNGIVASSDYPGYMKHEVVTNFSRSGNVNTFFTSSPTYPLVFAKPAGTDAVGILAIRATSGGYYVDVLCDGSCSIIVFRAISGAASGYGLAFYNTSGALTFSSEKDMLAANSIASMAEGVSAAVVGDAVSYSAAHLRARTTETMEFPYITSYSWLVTVQTQTYQCRMESQFQCWTEYQSVPSYSYQCSYDFSGAMTCSSVTTYVTQAVTVCGMVPVQVCGFVIGWEQQWQNRDIFASVRRTDWAIDRGAVYFENGIAKFRWIRHKSGYYRTVLGYTEAPKYIPPSNDEFYSWIVGSHEGEIKSGSTFPYTNITYNGVTTYAATLRSSDYV